MDAGAWIILTIVPLLILAAAFLGYYLTGREER